MRSVVSTDYYEAAIEYTRRQIHRKPYPEEVERFLPQLLAGTSVPDRVHCERCGRVVLHGISPWGPLCDACLFPEERAT